MTNDTINEATGSDITTTEQDDKNIALITWILTLFFGFIPSLVIYLLKKDSAYAQDQAKEALNWSLTAIFAYVVAFFLTFIAIGFLLVPVISLCHLIFCIMGAVATSKGSKFRVPFAIRLIK